MTGTQSGLEVIVHPYLSIIGATHTARTTHNSFRFGSTRPAMNSSNNNDFALTSRRCNISAALKKETDHLIRLTLDRKIDLKRDAPSQSE